MKSVPICSSFSTPQTAFASAFEFESESNRTLLRENIVTDESEEADSELSVNLLALPVKPTALADRLASLPVNLAALSVSPEIDEFQLTPTSGSVELAWVSLRL